MNEKDSPDDSPVTRTEAEGATVDLPEGLGFFTTGQVLGERYEILEMLGRGGMGEVWRAFDLKLRVEVGLKALREELFQSERRLELLRQEVRAAREVVSPNVCRIFDLIEVEGRELVSMEYVDGATLLGVLQERGPLELKEAQDIASQFLAGLEAIHKAGLVHRDVKPENIMLTRAGRVVVMDFGLARGPESGAGSVSGTPAYMAPEHAAGQDVDARADVYSAGIVLAEMVSPDGVKSYESRQSVWEGVRSEPAKLPDSPWAPVIKRAVARDRERRPNSAHTLIRELEDVTLRVEGAEDLHPYPGLASFTENDAEYFFGRESEVESMWRKLEGPPRMLGIMGPSGAGKTSFIRAGLTPNAPAGWTIIRCTPGNAAIASLRSTITPELAKRPELLQALMADPNNEDVIIDALSAWRAEHRGALIIFDQFEELFTLSSKENQRSFASLLGRLPLESDIHVILAMRDDFAAYCNTHQGLQPIFHELTVLNPPTGGNLRRALVQPATKCGYRFENDELVDEMLVEVEGERGALPLLAFAAARLWEKRDRDSGLLNRQAFHDIGGVGGALARHAEATIDRIGVEHIAIVRELFRNLVTAEGTRAVREWDELLSVFEPTQSLSSRTSKASRFKRSTNTPVILSERSESKDPPKPGAPLRKGARSQPVGDPSTRSSNSLAQGDMGGGSSNSLAQGDSREVASEVLSELIDARLLTSYEIREDEHEPVRRVEIIHESLLANWPRLVRWQTQDVDAVQLRDQLRQAARTWDEHSRTDDTLWTGSAYREYALWRERYPGGLTEIEEAFAAAMTSFATRRRRRRRIAATAAVIVFAVIALIFAGLWRRSVIEARRAEAQKLLALGQIEIEEDPTAALAYARASLGVSDTFEGRVFALRALSTGSVSRILPRADGKEVIFGAVFSPDGEWAALSAKDQLRVVGRSGGQSVLVDTIPPHGQGGFAPFFDHSTGRLGAFKAGGFRTYEVPGFTEIARHRVESELWDAIPCDRGTLLLSALGTEAQIQVWSPESGAQLIGTFPDPRFIATDPTGTWMAYVPSNADHQVYLKSLTQPCLSDRLLHTHDKSVSGLAIHPELEWLAVRDEASGTITVWALEGPASGPIKTFDDPGLEYFSSDHMGNRIIEAGLVDGNPTAFVWDLQHPDGASPLFLRSRMGGEMLFSPTVEPSGRWLVAGSLELATFWPLPEDPVIVIPSRDLVYMMDFTPDGKALAIPSYRGLYLQPIRAGDHVQHVLENRPTLFAEFDPEGRFVIGASKGPSAIMVVPTDGSAPISLEGFTDAVTPGPVTYDPERELVAAGASRGPAEEKTILVWNLADGSRQTLGPTDNAGEGMDGAFLGLEFLADGSLLSASRDGGIRRWRLADESSEQLLAGNCWGLDVSSARDIAVSLCGDAGGGTHGLSVVVIDVATNQVRTLDHFHGEHTGVALSPAGDLIATGTHTGEIKIGRVSGGEPHILFGHGTTVLGVAISPDGQLIAAADQSGNIRIWPVPDMTRPSFQALPYAELMAKLDSFTNLRVVRDETSPTGWKTEIGPFKGWADVPEW
jgi:serine/threonine protein kinase/WD40 repeat protein